MSVRISCTPLGDGLNLEAQWRAKRKICGQRWLIASTFGPPKRAGRQRKAPWRMTGAESVRTSRKRGRKLVSGATISLMKIPPDEAEPSSQEPTSNPPIAAGDNETTDDRKPIDAEAERPPGRIIAVIRQEVRRELRFFSGPLPPPDVLREYNEIVPGSAERILQMAEREQSHRHGAETRDGEGGLTLAKRGQLVGAVLAFMATTGGMALLALGRNISGFAIIASTVAIFGAAFIYDRWRPSSSERLELSTEKSAEPGSDLPTTPH